MDQPVDTWAALTKLVLRLLQDAHAEGAGVDVDYVVATALHTCRDLPGARQHRMRLVTFVRDIVGAAQHP